METASVTSEASSMSTKRHRCDLCNYQSDRKRNVRRHKILTHRNKVFMKNISQPKPNMGYPPRKGDSEDPEELVYDSDEDERKLLEEEKMKTRMGGYQLYSNQEVNDDSEDMDIEPFTEPDILRYTTSQLKTCLLDFFWEELDDPTKEKG